MSLKSAIQACIKMRKEPFKLSAGETSRFYVSIKNLLHEPTIVAMIIRKLEQYINFGKYNKIVGIEIGSIGLAAIVGYHVGIPWLTVRKERKEGGLQKCVEGTIKKYDQCLLLEDVITTATTVKRAIKYLQEEGLIVTQIVSIVDRNAGVFTEFGDISYINLYRLLVDEETGAYVLR